MNKRLHWFSLVVTVALLVLMPASNKCTLSSPTTPAQPTRGPSPLPTMMERGLLLGDPCEAPCWEGITPGISSEDDVVRTLDQLTVEGRIESYVKESRGCYFEVEFPIEGRVCIRLSDGYVLELTVDYGRVNHRVRQVIERLGEPEAYALHSNVEREDGLCEKELDDSKYYSHPSSPAYLLYPSQGVTVMVLIPDYYTGCLCAEMWAKTFSYYHPRSLADALQEERSVAFGYNDWSSEDLFLWHGYGCGY